MISTQKRDLVYSFAQVVYRPVLTEVIDDAWRAEKLVDLDMVIPHKTVANKLNQDADDEEHQHRIPILDARTWNDNGISELITPLVSDMQSADCLNDLPKISSIR